MSGSHDFCCPECHQIFWDISCAGDEYVSQEAHDYCHDVSNIDDITWARSEMIKAWGSEQAFSQRRQEIISIMHDKLRAWLTYRNTQKVIASLQPKTVTKEI